MAQNPKSEYPKPKIRNPNPQNHPLKKYYLLCKWPKSWIWDCCDFGLDFNLKKMDFGFGAGPTKLP